MVANVNASGSRHSIAYVKEVDKGVTPAAAAFQTARYKTTTLGLTKSTMASEEIRSDRQISDFRHGIRSGDGNIAGEESALSYDDWLEAALCGTWVPNSTTGSISLSASVGGFARAAGDFTADGFAVGDTITASGFVTAGNNGRFRITAVDALTLTVTAMDEQVMAIDAAAAARKIDTIGATLKAGIVRRSFSLLRNFEDIAVVQISTGAEFSGFTLNCTPGAIAQVTFNVMANDVTTADAVPAGSTFAPATTTPVLNTLTGSLLEGVGGGVAAPCTEVQMTLDNGMQNMNVIGSATAYDRSIGRSMLTGTSTFYFKDRVVLDKFINETESAIKFQMRDALGTSGYDVLVPRIKYTGAPIPVQNEGPITIAMPWQALLDPTTASNIVVTRILA